MRRDETGDRDKTVAFVAYVLYCGSRHGKGIEGGVWRKRVVFCCDFCSFVRSFVRPHWIFAHLLSLFSVVCFCFKLRQRLSFLFQGPKDQMGG